MTLSLQVGCSHGFLSVIGIVYTTARTSWGSPNWDPNFGNYPSRTREKNEVEDDLASKEYFSPLALGGS